jgi:hypothetical protein
MQIEAMAAGSATLTVQSGTLQTTLTVEVH